MAPRAKAAAELLAAKLASSGLDAEDGRTLGLRLAADGRMESMGFPERACLEFPYHGLDGRPTGFSRWRYLEDSRDDMERKTSAKPLRYVQEPNSLQQAYFPRNVDWRAVAGDSSRRVLVTEGELKAACATKHGHPCVGLGGVSSFKSAKRKVPLLPELRSFSWAGRTVVVVYDSDAATNSQVVAARNELCALLTAAGAVVCVGTVQPGEGGGKRGIDDLVVEEGPEALDELVASAEPFSACEELWRLNAEVAYVRNPGMVVVLDSGLKMRASDFTSHAYSDRFYQETSVDAKGGTKMSRKPAAAAWLAWPQRAVLERITFAPGEPRVTSRREFNTWRGWGCEPKKGDVAPWRALLDHLFRGYAEERGWFERWCALPLQRPGAKMYTAAVVWGTATGTGKSLAGYTLGKIYGTAFTKIGDRELQDSRNEWAQDKQFVLGDDVTGHEQRKYADRLKAMITQNEIRIDPKYVPSFEIPDRINYLFTSNHPDAFFLEDDDRRFFVHQVQSKPLPREFYRGYMEWLRAAGPSALFHHLLRLDTRDQEPEDRAPDTDARRAMIDDGLSDVGRWVRRLRDDPGAVLRVGDSELTGDLWSSADLLGLYDPEGRGRTTAGGLGRELKRAGVPQYRAGQQVRTGIGQQRLFVIRNEERWAKAHPSDATAHYDATRSPLRRERKF